MSFPEILSLVLLAVVALQMWLIRWVIENSLQVMRSCSETTDMAVNLSKRVLDSASSPLTSNKSNTGE